jgi:hypothetical protein
MIESEQSQKALRTAVRYLLKPIARILIRGGISWKEFADLGKDAFVEAASEDYGIAGRQTNASRVALLTGLSRREVARIRESHGSGHDHDESEVRETQIPRLLAGWHQDPTFLDDGGKPRELSKSDQPGEFGDLLKRYAGDIPPVAFTKELLRLKLIKEQDGKYVVLNRIFTPDLSDPSLLRQAGLALHDHAATVAHNLNNQREGGPRFERLVSNLNVSEETAEKFHELLKKEGQQFLEKLDAWLSQHDQPRHSGRKNRPVRVGAGIYFIKDSGNPGDKK